MSVDLDRQLREYCRLMDQAQDPLSFDDIRERSGELAVIPGRTILQASPRRAWIAPAIAALAILIVVTGRLLPTGDPGPADQQPAAIPLPTTAPGNGWIAFSTQPGGAQIQPGWDRGGDIYLVRAGVMPKLIVGRGETKITNICPTFSPNGSKLAYGERAGSDTALVVLSVDFDGSVKELTRIDAGAGEPAPCPRWSQDGERLVYLSGKPADGLRVVVSGLDGSTLEPRDEDPTVAELGAASPRGVVMIPSPDGALVARLERCLISVANTDGSERREISRSECDYAIAGWSPDGRYVLVMTDVSGRDASMTAVSVEEPFESIVLVSSVPVNGARSWPGFGDVSWQPVFSGS